MVLYEKVHDLKLGVVNKYHRKVREQVDWKNKSVFLSCYSCKTGLVLGDAFHVHA